MKSRMPTRLNDGEGCTDGQVIDVRPHPIRALVKAAADDDRTVNGLVERVLADYCRAKGFLK